MILGTTCCNADVIAELVIFELQPTEELGRFASAAR